MFPPPAKKAEPTPLGSREEARRRMIWGTPAEEAATRDTLAARAAWLGTTTTSE